MENKCVNLENWTSFTIESLFDIHRGKNITKKDQIPGDIPYIGASKFNQGITGYVGNTNNREKPNVITVSVNGSVGYAFWQEKEFLASSDVAILEPKKELNKYQALFLCAVITSVGQKYNYNDKWSTKECMPKDCLYLPAKDNKPDWDKIEELAKEIDKRTKEKIEEIKTYI